jgi:phosphosulfolactate synthase (CoM biosynthesis protein A)
MPGVGLTANSEAHLDDGRIVNMETTEKQRAIERLCFIAKIEEGFRQSDARQLVSHDEVKKQSLSCGPSLI